VKALFLDFDGVLNSHKSWLRDKPEIWNHIDPEAMENLKEILARISELKIVISSTWRFMMPLEKFRDFLQGFEIEKNRIIGYTPGRMSRYRGHEIKSWLAENPEVEKFVILDDDNDMNPLLKHLVQTDGKVGLTKADAEEVIRRLE
jgi:hypothetical protein